MNPTLCFIALLSNMIDGDLYVGLGLAPSSVILVGPTLLLVTQNRETTTCTLNLRQTFWASHLPSAQYIHPQVKYILLTMYSPVSKVTDHTLHLQLNANIGITSNAITVTLILNLAHIIGNIYTENCNMLDSKSKNLPRAGFYPTKNAKIKLYDSNI